MRQIDNDVYVQIGLLTLIGLAAKNAILIVEFALEKHHEGMSFFDAAVEAARLRFRPIIMTSFAFILGCIPLAFASGPSANSRQSLGTSVIGGSLAATVIAIFFIPMFFWLLENISNSILVKLQMIRQSLQNEGIINMHRMLLTSIILLCLTGCLLGPNYKRPYINIPQSFRFEPKVVAETANIQWWKQFNDPVLNQLIAEALAKNYDVKIAAANIMQAAGILMTTRSAFSTAKLHDFSNTRAIF